MLSRVDEPGCLSAGFMQGVFILLCGGSVFLGVSADGGVEVSYNSTGVS